MAGYKAHVRNDNSAKGRIKYRLTGVEYTSHGIIGLRHTELIRQIGWVIEPISGNWTTSYPLDSATSRLPFHLECTAVGSVKARNRFHLPKAFGTTPRQLPAQSISFYVRRNAPATSATLTLYKNGSPDSTLNGSDILPGSDNTWTLFQFQPGGNYFGEDWFTLEIEYVADTNGDWIDIADGSLEYDSYLGNYQ